MEVKHLSLGYSPCPNDTFIFEAIANKRIDTSPFRLKPVLKDVESLNLMARNRKLDITKISFPAMVHCLNEYWLIRSGGALTRGDGPLVVGRQEILPDSLQDTSIAIPGKLTSAFLLLRFLVGRNFGEVIEMPFFEIMPEVAAGRVDFGLVIHEGRFTYKNYGLRIVVDLGVLWEEKTGLPLPLGGIAIRRGLGKKIARFIEGKIKESLAYAQSNPTRVLPYVRAHAKELDDDVIRKHIEMFVNSYTADLGIEGKQAIRRFLEIASQISCTTLGSEPLFWDEE